MEHITAQDDKLPTNQ